MTTLDWLKEVVAGPLTDECIDWPFSRHPMGYGQTGNKHGERKAHRVAWSIYHGRPFPEGLLARHLCGRPCCVNPLHIEPGTSAQNSADMLVHGTRAFAERNPSTKITTDQVREILLTIRTESSASIAGRLGVDPTTVVRIAGGRERASEHPDLPRFDFKRARLRTECVRGHSLEDAYVRRGRRAGDRVCRTCALHDAALARARGLHPSAGGQ